METDPERSVRIIRRGRGFAAWGPGFYVWEEDAAELIGVAGALALAGRGTVVPPPEDTIERQRIPDSTT